MHELLALIALLLLGTPDEPGFLGITVGVLTEIELWQESSKTAPGELAELRTRLREAGEPLAPSELALPRVERDASAWLAAIGPADDELWDDPLRGIPFGEELEGEIGRLERTGAAPWRLGRLRAQAEPIGEQDDYEAWSTTVPAPVADLPAHVRAYLELQRVRLEPLERELARVLEFDGFDARSALLAWSGEDREALVLDMRGMYCLQRIYTWRAVLAAAEGRSEAVSLELRRLEHLCDMALTAVGSDARFVRFFLVRSTSLSIRNLAPSLAVRHLDRHLRWLERQAPRAALAEWVRTERVVRLHWILSQYRVPKPPSERYMNTVGLMFGLGSEPDELFFLQHMERLIQYIQLDWRDALETDVEVDPQAGQSGIRYLVSTALLPPVRGLLEDALCVETELLFSQASLRVHRDGLASALTWLETRRDPFSGEALRRRQDGQTWLFWSVGPDLVDQGGSSIDEVEYEARWEGCWDVVCRLRAD